MELIIEGRLMPADRVAPLLDEAVQLVKIMAASRRTSAHADRNPIANRNLQIANP
jgi:hypothetical protein